MNFEVNDERLVLLEEQSAFINLAISKKRKDAKTIAEEETAGLAHQDAVRAVLRTLRSTGRYMDPARFLEDLEDAGKARKVKIPAPVKKAILNALESVIPERRSATTAIAIRSRIASYATQRTSRCPLAARYRCRCT